MEIKRDGWLWMWATLLSEREVRNQGATDLCRLTWRCLFVTPLKLLILGGLVSLFVVFFWDTGAWRSLLLFIVFFAGAAAIISLFWAIAATHDRAVDKGYCPRLNIR